jgi:hypothetical protein
MISSSMSEDLTAPEYRRIHKRLCETLTQMLDYNKRLETDGLCPPINRRTLCGKQ